MRGARPIKISYINQTSHTEFFFQRNRGAAIILAIISTNGCFGVLMNGKYSQVGQYRIKYSFLL
jgi:hypothetical protein